MISIIGAGPIGSYLAYRLKMLGKDVSVYEEHDIIGEPVQCSGIVTPEINKIIKIDKRFLVNKFKKVKIYSKHKSVILDNNDILIDRRRFDRYLFEKALKKGVKFYLNHRYAGMDKNKVYFDNKGKIVRIKSDIVMGADGPLSHVAKSNAIYCEREFYVGVQARVKGNFDKDCYEVYLGSICPGFFAWIIPESESIARIGIASKRNASNLFSKFLSLKGYRKEDIIERQGGLIPIWNKKIEVQKDNVYLVGDAAAHVKATTGGGLVPGLKVADRLADCIKDDNDYKKALKLINKELNMHLRIRKILDKFSDKDYDNLLELLNQNKVKKTLKINNRDRSVMLIIKLILAEPRMLFYAKKLF